jgi:hypothetical protein
VTADLRVGVPVVHIPRVAAEQGTDTALLIGERTALQQTIAALRTFIRDSPGD